MFEKIKRNFKATKKGIILITYGIVLYFLLQNAKIATNFVKQVFFLTRPLFLGIGIAYVLNLGMDPLENVIERYVPQKSFIYKKRRGIALVLTLIFAIFLILTLSSIIIPQLVDSTLLLLNNLGSYIKTLSDYLMNILKDLHLNNGYIMNQLSNINNLPWDQVLGKAINWLGEASSSIGNMANDVVSTTMDFIKNLGLWFTGFMVSLYLLSGKEKFIYQCRKLTLAVFGKELAAPLFKWAHVTNMTFKHFIGGQLVEASILFVLYYVTMSIFRFPYALLISLMIGVTSIVPIFGAMLGAFIGFVLILAINPMQGLGFFVFYLVLQQIEDNLIYPKVVGDSVGLPGVFVLVAIMAFGSLYGLIGMITAVPIAAVLYQGVAGFARYGIEKRGIELDENGFAKEEA